jgi:uncharacterized membrane protein YeaQ/YmgE (transglycosylase-associated protein family)
MKVQQKKGDIFQIIFVLVIVLVMAILGLLCGKLGYEITEAYKDPALGLQDTDSGSQANTQIQQMSIPLMDFFIFFFFLGSNIGLIISAIKTKYSPTIIFLFILLLLLEILLASGVVNLYQGFQSETSLDPIPTQFVLTNMLLSKYFPLIISVIGAVVLIFMYSKQEAPF